MSQKQTTKMVYEAEFVAEVQVVLIESDDAWAPYLSLEDAKKTRCSPRRTATR